MATANRSRHAQPMPATTDALRTAHTTTEVPLASSFRPIRLIRQARNFKQAQDFQQAQDPELWSRDRS